MSGHSPASTTGQLRALAHGLAMLPEEVLSSHRKEFGEWVGGAKKEPRQGGALRSSLSARTAAEGGYSTLAQMNTVELCLPVIGFLLGPVLIYMDFPSMLN